MTIVLGKVLSMSMPGSVWGRRREYHLCTLIPNFITEEIKETIETIDYFKRVRKSYIEIEELTYEHRVL